MDQLLRRNSSHRKQQQEALDAAAKKKKLVSHTPRGRVYREAHMLLPIDYVSSARTIGDARLSASKLSKQLERITMKHNSSSEIDPNQMIRVSRREHIRTAILNETTAATKRSSVLAAGGRALVARANIAAAAAATSGASSSRRKAAADNLSDAAYNTELLKMEQLEMARGLEKVYSLAAAMRDDAMFIGFTQVRKQKMMEQAWINSMQTYNPVMVDQRMKRMYARKQLVALNRKFGTPTWTTTAMCLGAAVVLATAGTSLLAATPFASYFLTASNAGAAYQVVSGCWYMTEGAHKAYQTKDWRYLTSGVATGLTKIVHVAAFGYMQAIGGAAVAGLPMAETVLGSGSYLATGVSYVSSAVGYMTPVVMHAIFDPATGSISNAYITKLAYISEDEKQFQQLQERITKRQLLEKKMSRELEETRFEMAQEAYWKRPVNRNPKIEDMTLYLKMLGGKQYAWVHGMLWDKKTPLGKLTHWTYAKISETTSTQMGIRLIMSLLGRIYPQIGPMIFSLPAEVPPEGAAAEQTVVTLSSLLTDVFGITGILTAAASVVYQTIIAPLVISIAMALGSALLSWGVYKFTPRALAKSKTYQRWQAWSQNNRLVDSGKFIMTVWVNSVIRGALLKRFDEMDRTKHFTEKEWTAYTNSVEYLNRTDDAWTSMYHLFVDGIYGGGDLSRNWADPTETRVLDGEEIYALKGTSRLYKNENDFEKVYTASIFQEDIPSYGTDVGSPAGIESINMLNFADGKGNRVKVAPGLFQAQSFWVKRQAPGAPPGTMEFVKLNLLEAQVNTMNGNVHTQESFISQSNAYVKEWLLKHPAEKSPPANEQPIVEGEKSYTADGQPMADDNQEVEGEKSYTADGQPIADDQEVISSKTEETAAQQPEKTAAQQPSPQKGPAPELIGKKGTRVAFRYKHGQDNAHFEYNPNDEYKPSSAVQSETVPAMDDNEVPELIIEDVDRELEETFSASVLEEPRQQLSIGELSAPSQVVSSAELTEEMEEGPQQTHFSSAIEPQTNKVNPHSKWVTDRLNDKDVASVIKLVEGTKALQVGDHFLKIAGIDIERAKASVQYLTQYETQLQNGIDLLDSTYESLKAEDTSGASNVDEYISSVVTDLFLSNPLMSREDTNKLHDFLISMKNVNNGMVDISDSAFADFIGGFRTTMETQLKAVAATKTNMASHMDQTLGETFFDDLTTFLKDSRKMLENPPSDFGEADLDNMNDAMLQFGEKLSTFSKLNNELIHETETISDSAWTVSHFGGWNEKLTFFSPLKWLQGNFSPIATNAGEESTKQRMTAMFDRVRASEEKMRGSKGYSKDFRKAMEFAFKGDYSSANEIIDSLVARNVQQQQLENEQLRFADLRRDLAGQIFDATTAARSLYSTFDLIRNMIDREIAKTPGGDPALDNLKAEVGGHRNELMTLVNTVYSKYVLHPDLSTEDYRATFTQENIDVEVNRIVDLCGQILDRYESGFFGGDENNVFTQKFLQNNGIKNFAFDEDLINAKLDNIDVLLKTNERLSGGEALDKYYQAQDELLQLRADLFDGKPAAAGGIEGMGQRLLKKYQLIDNIVRLDTALSDMLGVGATDFIYGNGAQQIDIPNTRANAKINALVARFEVMHEIDPRMLELTNDFKVLYDKHRTLETLDLHSESADKIFGSTIEYMRDVIRGDKQSSVFELESLMQQTATIPETYTNRHASYRADFTVNGQYRTVLNDKASRLNVYPAETIRVLSDLEKSIAKLDEFTSNTPSRAPVDHLSSQLKQSYVRFVRLAATNPADGSLLDLTNKLIWTTNHDLAKFYSYVHHGLTETPAARLEQYGATPHAVHAATTFFDGVYQSNELANQAQSILNEQIFPFMEQVQKREALSADRYNMSDSANDVVYFYENMEKTLSPDFAAMYVFEGMNIYGEYASKFADWGRAGMTLGNAPPPGATYDETAKFKEIIIEATTREQIVDNIQAELENPVLAEQEHSDELLKMRHQAEELSHQKRRRAAQRQMTAARDEHHEKMRQLVSRIPPTEIQHDKYILEEEFKRVEDQSAYKKIVNARGKVFYQKKPELDTSDRDTFTRFVDDAETFAEFYGGRDGQENLSKKWDLDHMMKAMTTPGFIHDATEFNTALLSMLGIRTPEQIRAYVVDNIMKHNPYGYRGMKRDELMEESQKSNDIVQRKMADPKFMGSELKQVLDEIEEEMTVYDEMIGAVSAALEEIFPDLARCVSTIPDQHISFSQNDVSILVRGESGLYRDDPDLAELCLVTPLAVQLASPLASAMNTLGGTEVASTQALSLAGSVFNFVSSSMAGAVTDTTLATMGDAAAAKEVLTMDNASIGAGFASYFTGRSSIVPTLMNMVPSGRVATTLAYAANVGEIHLMQNVAPAADSWIDEYNSRWGEDNRSIDRQREMQGLGAGMTMAHTARFGQTMSFNANPEKWKLYNGTSREMGSKTHLGLFLVELGMAQYKHGADNSSVVDIVKNSLTGGINIATELRDMTVLLKDLELGDEPASIDAAVKIMVRMSRTMSELVSPEMKAALTESDVYDAGNLYEFEQQAKAFRGYTEEDWLAYENKLLASDGLRDTLRTTGLRTALGGVYSALKVSALVGRTTVGAVLGTVSSVAGDKTLQDATTMALFGTAGSSVLKTDYDAVGASMKSGTRYFHPDSDLGWMEYLGHTTLNVAGLALGMSSSSSLS